MHARIKIITAMLIFGSIGAFVRNINLSSGEIAFLRGVIGSIFLIGAGFFLRQEPSYQEPSYQEPSYQEPSYQEPSYQEPSYQEPSYKSIKRNIALLTLSGAALGINWIFLFQAYEYTSIANATLSYYFAPIFVIILAPFILKEKLTPVRVVCVFAAMFGLFLIVKVGNGNLDYSYNHTSGIIYGLLAAIFYASVILMNKFIKNLSDFETTLVQLMSAVLVLFPYVALKNGFSFSGLFGVNSNAIILILIVGIIHTGFAYFLYFTAIRDLKGQTIAVLSYIDPISAVIIAAVFLGEAMNSMQIIGGMLILGSTFLSKKLSVRI